ncbi:ABC transporter substrate-binding protein [Microlunatus parietis]|uniref:Peptide/nickel transport system substrate-binding protein n=1 Tax=Microlunatus parietis TaxID=682979 RepID=A0A7Y9I9D2_9ACTN|nr:ABC transporter substrate-binding protein [Microlunatus parietis]NYE72723.1 peptide/nickel transport system substrate-binding protein [Microlunatus parietis]
MSRRARFTKGLTVLAATVALALAGCNAGSNLDQGSSPGSSSSPGSTELPVITVGGGAGPFAENFNPFSPNVMTLVHGVIYEPLFYFNQLKPIDQAPIPLLGTEYTWNDDGTVLTIKVRTGVQWSDGTPMTAKDVAFTFDLIQKTEELNTSGHSPKSKLIDDSTVELTFDRPSFAEGPNVLGRTYIVPEHLWSKIKDPVTEPNKKPVGTGAFMMDSFTQQSYALTRNPEYWQEGKPGIGGVRVITLSGNQAATDKYLAGEIDYQSAAIPNLDQLIKNKPELTYLNTGTAQAALFTCANAELGCEGPQTDPAVRRALYLGMDREQLSNLAFYKLGKPVSPAFALPERDRAFIEPSIADAPWTADVAAAKKALEDAGYQLADGVYAKDGKPLRLSIKVVSGWTDFITAVDTLKQQFAAIGIEIVPQQVSVNEWNSAKSTGKFQLVIDSLGQGPAPDPYYVYNNFFSTEATDKVGGNANPYRNTSRFSDPAVDAALTRAAGSNDIEIKRAAYFEIQKIISADLPYVPLLIGSTLTEFNTSKVTGFPTEDNLYAFPAAWAAPDNAQVLVNLTPAP